MSKKGQHWTCECLDLNCLRQVFLPERVVTEIGKNNYNCIVDGCAAPLPEGATLIRQCEGGYSLYKFDKFADE